VADAVPDASTPLTPGAAPASGAPVTSPRRPQALAHAGMFVFGIVMALVGAIVPTLTTRLPLTLGDVGTLFLAMNATMLVASLVVGLLMDRQGLRLPLVAGAWLVALALVLIARATGLAMLLPAVACLGFGGGMLNAGTNTLVADLHPDPSRKAAALNLLGVFFGFGALVLPFGIGALVTRLGVGSLLLAGAVLCGVIGLAGLLVAFPAPKQRHGWPLAELPRFVRLPIIRAFGLLLFFQSGNEFLLGGYITSLLTREVGLSVAAASYALAGYWGALMAARVVLSRLLLHVTPHAVVLGSALLAGAGTLVLATAGVAPAAVGGTVLTGFAMAGIFPSVLGITGARFREHSGTVFGILFTIALSGGMTIPWLGGHLAEAAGLRWIFVLAAANFGAIAGLMLMARRLNHD
jgi:MFS transporter, FHS family, glucose/mannose:H+ symporter